jgi:hypothetical protein
MKQDERDPRAQSKYVSSTMENNNFTFRTSSCSSFDAEDSASYTDSSDDEHLFECSLEKAIGRNTMSINEIAKMLGSVNFNEVKAESPSAQKPRVSRGDSATQNALDIGSGIHGSSLPVQNKSLETGTALTKILDDILKEHGYKTVGAIPKDKVPDDFFEEITETNIKAYTLNVINAVRSQDINELERLLDEGHCMQSCNKFGESILHLACRRGCTDVVRFLVEKAQISVNIKDDYGRTPLHDACWVSTPNFELLEIIIKESPNLLLITDKRGFTPLQYVRKEDTGAWGQFLNDKKILIKPIIL